MAYKRSSCACSWSLPLPPGSRSASCGSPAGCWTRPRPSRLLLKRPRARRWTGITACSSGGCGQGAGGCIGSRQREARGRAARTASAGGRSTKSRRQLRHVYPRRHRPGSSHSCRRSKRSRQTCSGNYELSRRHGMTLQGCRRCWTSAIRRSCWTALWSPRSGGTTARQRGDCYARRFGSESARTRSPRRLVRTFAPKAPSSTRRRRGFRRLRGSS